MGTTPQAEAHRAAFADVQAMRELHRQDMNCQIRHDSHLGRGIADAYLLRLDGAVAGYGGVLNQYDPGRLMEFYVLPHARVHGQVLFGALLRASGATQIAAQSNDPGLLGMLYDFGCRIATESILFEDAERTRLPCPEGAFRGATPEDRGPNPDDPPAPFVIEARGAIVAAGGFLTHYNPPYADIFMSVAPGERRRGFGSYLVQELKHACYGSGHRPAARCHPENVASRRTLEKAGLLPCARVLVGDVARI